MEEGGLLLTANPDLGQAPRFPSSHCHIPGGTGPPGHWGVRGAKGGSSPLLCLKDIACPLGVASVSGPKKSRQRRPDEAPAQTEAKGPKEKPSPVILAGPRHNRR